MVYRLPYSTFAVPNTVQLPDILSIVETCISRELTPHSCRRQASQKTGAWNGGREELSCCKSDSRIWPSVPNLRQLWSWTYRLPSQRAVKQHSSQHWKLGSHQEPLNVILIVFFAMQEYESGVPLRLCLQRGENGASPSGSEDLFPQPLAIGGGGSPRDIAFSMVKGDFQVRASSPFPHMALQVWPCAALANIAHARKQYTTLI